MVAGDEDGGALARPRDPIRGYVGDVFSHMFEALYAPPAEPSADEDAAAPDPEAADAVAEDVRVDLTDEENEIARIHASLGKEHSRIQAAAALLRRKRSEAVAEDCAHAEHLQQRWGLTLREQVPVGQSTLKHLLRPDHLEADRLLLPRDMMLDVERHIAIKSGTVQQHENLLAISKPDLPNYLKETQTTKLRMHTRNIQSTFTPAQRKHLQTMMEEHALEKPPPPPMLNAEERARNREIVQRMMRKINFLKNPRYAKKADSAENQNPFSVLPEFVVFRNYEVGSVYEIVVELRNVTPHGRRVRVRPCPNKSFAVTALQYETDTKGRPEPFTVIAPGMAAFVTVRFAPSSLDEMDENLTIETELGSYALPVRAQRMPPKLFFREPVNCGEILAGQLVTLTTTISNRGGEGSFRLVPSETEKGNDGSPCQYENTPGGNTTLVSKAFRVCPATFYLEAGESVELEIIFGATDVGYHQLALLVEGDNGETTPLTLKAISDAVRVELLRWPTLADDLKPIPTRPGISPLSMVPWQLNWLRPGAQVGCSEAQSITISNGSHLPVKVEWRFALPPRQLLSELSVGNVPRLNQDILHAVHLWQSPPPEHLGQAACPFTIRPMCAEIEPFKTATFTFAFYAYSPVGHRSTCFAYLAVLDLPTGGHCLPNLDRLLELQNEMQPVGYKKGLPLFGGSAEHLFDKKPLTDVVVDSDAVSESGRQLPSHMEKASSAVTAICLQGVSTAPAVTCLPRVLAFAGDVLPFVAHHREIVLKNTGPMLANFRVRLSSQTPPTGSLSYETLWVVAPHEVGSRPQVQNPPVGESGTRTMSPEETSQWLSSQWPPLPPDGDGEAASALGGFGAYVTAAVEPHEGCILPGQSAKISLVLRAAREADLDVQIVVDLLASLDANETVAAPIRIPILAAVRAPRVELRHTKFLDYGVVRAQSRHKAKLCVNNPSDMPMLVRLTHHKLNTLEAEQVNAAEMEESGADHERHASVEVRACRDILMRRGLVGVPPVGELARRGLPKTDMANEIEGDPKKSKFRMGSHQEVVDFFVRAVQAGLGNRSCAAVAGEEMREGKFEPWVHARSGTVDLSGRSKHKFIGRGSGARGLEDDDDGLENFDTLVGDDTDLLFGPACFVLFPRQSTEVQVTLRTSGVMKYKALLEASTFDSMHSQCVDVFADVQLPKLRLSTQHAYFPVTYLKTASEPFTMQLWNESDMPATYAWHVPLKLEEGLELQIEPQEGGVPPRGCVELQLVACPTRVAELSELLCQVFVGEVIQPLSLQVSCVVYGPEVDWAVVPPGQLPPAITHEPRKVDETGSETFQISTGVAPRGTPILDFGEIALGETRELQLVLYNRTGIATPFSASVEMNPAYDPLMKGRSIHSMLDAAMRMYQLSAMPNPQADAKQNFSTEPRAAGQGGDLDEYGMEAEAMYEGTETQPRNEKRHATGSRSDRSNSRPQMRRGTQRTGSAPQRSHSLPQREGSMPQRSGSIRFEQHTGSKKALAAAAKKRLLLDNVHERQAFRSEAGALYVRQKEMKEQGSVALKMGRGFAVKVDPCNDWLQPFSTTIIKLKCFSDLPGKMEDFLVLNLRELPGHCEGLSYKIPVRLESHGNPLYLPDQQIGLTKSMDPPRLLCGTMVPAEKYTRRQFKVGNNSSAPIVVSWDVFPKRQLDNLEEERSLLSLKLCRTGNEDPFVEHGQQKTTRQSSSLAGDYEDTLDREDDAELEASLAREGIVADEDDDEAPFKFEMWASDPPAVRDPFAIPGSAEPPVSIEPSVATLPVHGTSVFTVTMLATKATQKADSLYRYVLVAKGRFAEGRAENTVEAALTASAVQARSELADVQEAPEAKPDLAVGKGFVQVTDLPDIELGELHEDDSDNEAPTTHAMMAAPDTTRTAATEAVPRSLAVEKRDRAEKKKKEENAKRSLPSAPEPDVISTIVVDCVGDCIVPFLTVDKKGNPAVEDYPPAEADDDFELETVYGPVFKFIHSVETGRKRHKEKNKPAIVGAVHGGARGGSQHPGVKSYIVRNVTLHNSNDCNVNCRFRIEGPFKIKQITQVGRHPVTRPQGDAGDANELFIVAKRETVSLDVEFVPGMVPDDQWIEHKAEHVFHGDLVLEYPRDVTGESTALTDLQRIHLVAYSRRPLVKVTLVPHARCDASLNRLLAHQPPWSGAQPVLVEFGYVHVDSSTTRKRDILLSNESSVPAQWKLLHVGRKRRQAHYIGNALREEEDFRALDDKDVFEFDITDGTLLGPSKDGLIQGTNERQVHWCQVPAAQPRAPPAADDHLYEPLKMSIVFRPKTNELYKCRFRIEVTAGLSVDFECRGCGSYDEEDDDMEYHEA